MFNDASAFHAQAVQRIRLGAGRADALSVRADHFRRRTLVGHTDVRRGGLMRPRRANTLPIGTDHLRRRALDALAVWSRNRAGRANALTRSVHHLWRRTVGHASIGCHRRWMRTRRADTGPIGVDDLRRRARRCARHARRTNAGAGLGINHLRRRAIVLCELDIVAVPRFRTQRHSRLRCGLRNGTQPRKCEAQSDPFHDVVPFAHPRFRLATPEYARQYFSNEWFSGAALGRSGIEHFSDAAADHDDNSSFNRTVKSNQKTLEPCALTCNRIVTLTQTASRECLTHAVRRSSAAFQ